MTTTKKSTYILLAAALLISFYILYLLADVVVILVISVLLTFIFIPLVSVFEKNGMNKLPATLIVFASAGFLIYLLLSFFIPKFFFQLNQLLNSLHDFSLHDSLVKIDKEIYTYLPFYTPGELVTRVEDFVSYQIVHSFDRISDLLSGIVSIVAILVIVPFITFFLLKDSRRIFRGILQTVPNKYFEMSYWILKGISNQLGRFVRAWIFDATFVGVTMGFGLFFIGIDNSLPLGLLAGLGHLVPYFGPIIGGIPAMVFSVIQYGDFSQIPYITLLLLTIYTLDNGIVQPFVFSKSVDMHPIVIILLIIAGSQLFGVLGMLLAVPTATVIKTAASQIYFTLKNYKIARL